MPGGNERTPLLDKKGGCCGGSKNGKCCGGSSALAPAAVPLNRNNRTGNSNGGEPVWGIERVSSHSSMRSAGREERRNRVDALLNDEEPLVSKCGADGGQCCKYPIVCRAIEVRGDYRGSVSREFAYPSSVTS